MTVLSREQIQELGLVENASPDAFQPNGVDLTVRLVGRFCSVGEVLRNNKSVAVVEDANWADMFDGWYLRPGIYLVTFNEAVKLPDDVMAYLHPRSTLLRCGVSLETAVWDAGYHGRGQSLLVVHNPHGFKVQSGARIAQMTFHRLDNAVVEGYSGSYQHEGL